MSGVSIAVALLATLTLMLGDTMIDASSFATTSSDGKFIAVMLIPDPERDGVELNAGSRAEVDRIRITYPVSGLYRNGETTPIWVMTQFESNIVVSADGHHLVAYDPLPSGSIESVLRFYEDGKMMKSYRLLDFPMSLVLAAHTVSHLQWLDRIELDAGRVRVTPHLAPALEFRLDGNRLDHSRALMAIVGAVCAAALIAICRRRRLLNA